MARLALLGFGRFGTAMASLLSAAGIEYRAFDPAGTVPEPQRAGSLAELAQGADWVGLAVPVPELAPALRALRPHLPKSAGVFDVGSVKVRPAEVLASVLGREVPWVATHPLFGPASVASGERPLRAVVCPNPLHPRAVAEVKSLFVRLGCEVIEQTPEEHDRVMARTQALTYFVAKGMIQLRAHQESAFAPPSFAAFIKLLERVQDDGEHLFQVLQTENPYAPEARRSLLEALSQIDRGLKP